MGDVLAGRVYRLQVETLLVTGLRVNFSVEKSTSSEPNKSHVSIYNLSEDTRARLSKMSQAQVTLEAGYPTTIARIFNGQTRKGPTGIQTGKTNTDWVTKLECGDGEAAFTEKRFKGSFGAGTPVQTVARELAKALGLGAGNLEAAMRSGNFRQGITEYPHGVAINGRASEELVKLMTSLGLEASIQDGQLQVLRSNETLSGQAVLLTPETGLIGTPSYGSSEEGKESKGPPTLKVKSFLQPSLRPGVQVKVESAAVRGYFKVKSVTHAGDSRSGDWVSECLCTAV